MLFLIILLVSGVYLAPAILALAFLPNWRWFLAISVLAAIAFWFLLPSGHHDHGGTMGAGDGGIVADFFAGYIQFACWAGLAITVVMKAASLSWRER